MKTTLTTIPAFGSTVLWTDPFFFLFVSKKIFFATVTFANRMCFKTRLKAGFVSSDSRAVNKIFFANMPRSRASSNYKLRRPLLKSCVVLTNWVFFWKGWKVFVFYHHCEATFHSMHLCIGETRKVKCARQLIKKWYFTDFNFVICVLAITSF